LLSQELPGRQAGLATTDDDHLVVVVGVTQAAIRQRVARLTHDVLLI
jgi:hypothetical protein